MPSSTQPAIDTGDHAHAHIRACAAAGDWLAAIAAAERLPAGQRDDALERDLVGWRIAAFEQVQPGSCHTAWPPHREDPFPSQAGVPEIRAGDLNLTTLAGGVVHHGCILVRGLLQAAEVQRLREDIDSAFAALHEAAASGHAAAPTSWYARLPDSVSRRDDFSLSRYFVEDGYGVLLADSPPSLRDLVAIFERHGIPSLLEAYFGERPALSVGKSTLRRVPPTLKASGWHQDGAFLGAGIRSMNAWLSLSHCGEDASGLDIVPRRFEHIIDTGTGNAPFSWAASDEAVRRAAGEHGIVSPGFEPGDVLFFDHMLMHRTGLPAGMCKPRWAIESWFFAPTGYPMDQIPLYI